MKTSLQKGFTLIELLVVIAIIGILSSVVLASLTTARSKGTDAAIQSTISNMRAQAELFYSNIGSYGGNAAATTAGLCTTGHIFVASTTAGTLSALLTDVATKNSGVLGSTKVVCATYGVPATAWAVIASTSPATGTSYCADSTGASRASVGISATATCI
jgi:prepilin-type N-terminal cleavage/methylation domain-containing protein